MRTHLTNAVYGAIDYASYPLGMLLVAPVVLHRLGASEYGLWMIVTAVISVGSIVAGGFSDANIQRVASLRASGARELMAHAVRGMLGINLAIGAAVVAVVWILAPYAAIHIASADGKQADECLVALRVASTVILARSVEAAGVSTQRAFEQYSGAVRISVAMRVFTLGSAAVLALAGYGMVGIMVATSIFYCAGACLQLHNARQLLGCVSLWPRFHAGETRNLLRLGFFAWLEAVGGLIFAQFDRIFLGVALGSVAVAPYALCVQFTQPLYALTASALSFLFPYLSRQAATLSGDALRRVLLKAFLCDLAIVGCCAVLLGAAGDRLIRLWAGAEVAQTASSIFPSILMGSALAGLSVTGTYAMQALGLFRTVAGLSLGGRAAMLLVMVDLLHRMGLEGLAIARVGYGAVALLVYVPLLRHLGTKRLVRGPELLSAIPGQLEEGSEP
jgi:O-antigen/teichoic acid export membrane protein